MDFTTSISFDQNYIHARAEGTNSVESVNGYLTDIRKAVEEHQCKKILIEDNLVGSGLDPVDVFEIVRIHGRYARDNKLRIAYIDLNKNHHRTTVAFGENLANIIGVKVKVFSETTEAKEWVLKSR